jgi:hypothetical protein
MHHRIERTTGYESVEFIYVRYQNWENSVQNIKWGLSWSKMWAKCIRLNKLWKVAKFQVKGYLSWKKWHFQNAVTVKNLMSSRNPQGQLF